MSTSETKTDPMLTIVGSILDLMQTNHGHWTEFLAEADRLHAAHGPQCEHNITAPLQRRMMETEGAILAELLEKYNAAVASV